MSDTLYRIESWRGADSLPRVGAFTVYEAVVVPVEIDYEAAKTCQTCEGSGICAEEHDHGMAETLSCLDCRGTGEWCNDWAVQYVLSQALRIGGPYAE